MSQDPVSLPASSASPETPPQAVDAVADSASDASAPGACAAAPSAPESCAPAATGAAESGGESAAADLPTAAGAAESGGESGAPGESGAGPESDGQPRRKVRLNPTVVPQALRPVPNLAATEPAVAPELTAAAAGSPSAAIPESAAATPPVAAQEPAPKPEPPRPRLPPVAIPRDVELGADVEAQLAAVVAGGQLETPAVAAPAEEGAVPVAADALEAGAKLKGTIQSISVDSVFLDLGLPMTGVVPLRQFDPRHPPKVGATVSVAVEKLDETEGLIHCNLPRGRGKVSHDWNAVVVGQTVDCNVVSTNKGGLEVTVGSLRGFLPASQVELGYAQNLDTYVGQKISVRVTEVNAGRRRLIVSRRLLLAEERQANEATLLDQIQAGQTHTGVVKSLKDFGAFIDLGGIDGFLHIGQISWQRINKPSDILAEGQRVEVKVLAVDREKKRISLSMRQSEQNPWTTAEEKYAKGTQVTGRVTRIEPFGAFIELEPGVEGLVHISELDHKRIRAVSDVLSQNQMVELQVLEVDPRKKRISLSAKALKAKPEEAAPPPSATAAPEPPPQRRKPAGNLKGGIGGTQPGGLFGDPRRYNQ